MDNRLFTRSDFGEDEFKQISADQFLAAFMARANKIKVAQFRKQAVDGVAQELEYFRNMKEDYAKNYLNYWEEWKKGTGQMIAWLANRKKVAGMQKEMLEGIKQSLTSAETENEELKVYIKASAEELDKLIADCATWDDNVDKEIEVYTRNLAEWTAEDWLKYTTKTIDDKINECLEMQKKQDENGKASDEQDAALAKEVERIFGCENFLEKMTKPNL